MQEKSASGGTAAENFSAGGKSCGKLADFRAGDPRRDTPSAELPQNSLTVSAAGGASPLEHRHGMTIPGPNGPPIVPFPRKRLALSAPGGASPLSLRY